MQHSDALTVLAAQRRLRLPAGKIDHRPAGRHSASGTRACLLRLADRPRLPAVDAFADHIRKGFENLRHLIKRHEQAVVLGREPPPPAASCRP